ncbi:hypothetical protein [Legionella sp. 227]|uniref:hypothetical protein n=1 Tax=Legionella sp. 227 TaxID=3367288 RepID=UPI00370DB0EE
MNNYQEITNSLNKLKNDPYQLINAMLNLQRQYPFDSEEFCLLISKFINNMQIDIFCTAQIAINSGINIFDASSLLIKILTRLKIISPDSLLDFLALFSEAAENDLALGMFYEPIKELARITNKNTDKIDKIESAILARKDSRLYGYLNSIYLGTVSKDFNVGYEKIIKMLDSEDNEIIATGVRSLGMIHGLSIEKIHQTQNRVANLCLNEDMQIASSAVFTLCKFAEKDNSLKEKIYALSESKHPEIQYEIAKYLQSKKGDMDNDDINLILNICCYNLKWKAISQSLDFILFDLTEKNKIKESIQIINKWISSHALEDLTLTKFEEIFHYSINNIVKNKIIMSYLTTDWLNSDDPRFHKVLNELFNFINTIKSIYIEVNPELLIDFKYNDFLYVMRKILGYINDYDHSAYLVASILKVPNLTTNVENLIKSILIEYHGIKYHNKINCILNGLLSKEFGYSVKAKRIIKECIAEIDQKNKLNNSLGKMYELQPNLDNQIKINRAVHQSISKASAAALSNSTLLESINKIQIKEGNSWFSYNQGQDIVIYKMNTLSHTIEIPRGEILDEIGSAMERFNFRRVKRGEN